MIEMSITEFVCWLAVFGLAVLISYAIGHRNGWYSYERNMKKPTTVKDIWVHSPGRGTDFGSIV